MHKDRLKVRIDEKQGEEMERQFSSGDIPKANVPKTTTMKLSIFIITDC